MIQLHIGDTEAFQRTMARTVGRAISLYGHSMVETLRLCRLQTRSNFERGDVGRTAMDTLHHGFEAPGVPAQPWRDDRFIFSTAWLNLGHGVRHLLFRPAGEPQGVAPPPTSATVYDAYGDVVREFPPGSLRPGGLVLAGPYTHPPVRSQCQDVDHLRPATSLVWLICRTRVEGPPAQALERLRGAMHIAGPTGTMNGRRPAAVELWEGEECDAFVSVLQQRAPLERLAHDFYVNLCHAFAQWPPRARECELVAALRTMGPMAGAALEWHALRAPVREGLAQGLEDAAWEFGAAWARRPAGRPAGRPQESVAAQMPRHSRL